MKKSTLVKAFLGLALAFTLAGCGNDKYANDTHLAIEDGKTVVERYGRLQVNGTDLCNSQGQPVQIRGMSSHGLQWYGKFANENVIRTLRDDWNCQLWRAAMYLTNGGYVSNPSLKQKVIDSIEACINLGMYVIVDWHVLPDKDPLLYEKYAHEFFTEIASTYGKYPNIIYEICNEPNGDEVTWKDNIKPYAERIIETIRKYDRDNVILVGTPSWSGNLTPAAEDPIIRQNNIMYVVHFYAGSKSGSNGKACRKMISDAMAKGLPVFISEWGVTLDSGDGGVFEKSSLEWIQFAKENNLSWANWSVNNKGEDSGVLAYNADRDATGQWKEKDLSKAGKFMRGVLRNEITLKNYKPSK
ncbi:MAG: glycoside hydrolase family 5 protein [Treponema sp.]|nr:glycoside hydrolase family 5 protein [Treponema sp.]